MEQGMRLKRANNSPSQAIHMSTHSKYHRQMVVNTQAVLWCYGCYSALVLRLLFLLAFAITTY